MSVQGCLDEQLNLLVSSGWEYIEAEVVVELWAPLPTHVGLLWAT